MPRIISVGMSTPKNVVSQNEVLEFARHLYSHSVNDLERILTVFQNGEIEKRYFAKELEWYQKEHSFSEKNEAFIEVAIKLSIESIHNCLKSKTLVDDVDYSEVDAIFLICTSGLATPSLEARIMNQLPFSCHTKRIPIWGLGCAGGASGLSRAYEYCRAFPHAKVLVVAVELCSLTFQKDDFRKSNLIGTSLFADGAASVLVGGDNVHYEKVTNRSLPVIIDSQSTLMADSLDVMGWDVKDNGLHVVFSKSIPTIIQNWLKPVLNKFVGENQLEFSNIKHFVLHPGGKKVITAYEDALGLSHEQTALSRHVLQQYGNMSSATVLFVLNQFMNKNINQGEYGIVVALGPGFSIELLLLRWQ